MGGPYESQARKNVQIRQRYSVSSIPWDLNLREVNPRSRTTYDYAMRNTRMVFLRLSRKNFVKRAAARLFRHIRVNGKRSYVCVTMGFPHFASRSSRKPSNLLVQFSRHNRAAIVKKNIWFISDLYISLKTRSKNVIVLIENCSSISHACRSMCYSGNGQVIEDT